MRGEKLIACILSMILMLTGVLQTPGLLLQVNAEQNQQEKQMTVYYYNDRGWSSPYLYYLW